VAGAEISSVGLLVRQLEEKAAKYRELAQPLTGRQLLVPVRRLAQDPATWRGDIRTAFLGWLDVFDSWIQNSLGEPLVDLATRVDHHIGELNDLARYAGMGVCPAPPRPMQPIRSEPGGLPRFELQLRHPPREQVSMAPDAMRNLAKVLSGAHEAIKAQERQVREALAPPLMPTLDPAIDLGPTSAHLPPDAARAVGQPTWYLAVAVELDKARVEILNRATKWEQATRASDGVAATPMVAGLLSSLEALKARAVQRAATGHSSPFASLAAIGPPAPPTPRDRRRQAESDAKRVMDKLRSGFFRLQDRKGAEKVLGRAAKAAAASPEYAEAFLKKLGPKGLRKLIDEGLDPCLVSEVVARASMAGVGVEFLKETLGKNRADKPQRAAQFAGCNCPNGTFHPAWAEYLVTILYQAPDTKPANPADPREWFRERAAVVIREHLARPPAGKEPEAADALERVVIFAADHELDPAGKRALAFALTNTDTINALAIACVPGAFTSGDAVGVFDPPRGKVTNVLPDLMADPEARRIILQAANGYAGDQLALAATQSAADGATAMARVGGLFGALASRPYSTQAAFEIRKAAADSTRSLLEKAGGKVIEAAKLAPVVSLAIEGGTAILFDTWEASSDHRESERELKDEREAADVRDQLRAELQADIEHLSYIAVLADPDQRQRLGLHLSPSDLPEVTPALAKKHNLGRTTRSEWQRALFDEHGQLRVPDPSDGRRWMLFRAWAVQVNPDLRGRVRELTGPAFDAMSGVGTS
jgi:hypothetical protein